MFPAHYQSGANCNRCCYETAEVVTIPGDFHLHFSRWALQALDYVHFIPQSVISG